ncbi:MAG TPA: RHS repeat domain-containing protein [Pyrinomonadaceae bacterium]|nr:RHS repeat domain-containing protein [Pyrinomonadaceae bacterium]
MLRRTLITLALAAACAAATLPAAAQQGGVTRYVYDDNGRLHAVISPSGETTVYEYDAAGNITAVRRLPADALALFNFSPREGYFGTLVTFTGTGFGGGVTSVTFNGTPGTVVEFTNSAVVAEVPQGATTGPVTINTPRGSVTTASPFTIRGVRVTPSSARITFRETVQFTAEVIVAGDGQGVTWSVNGIAGGNSSLGTITAAGLYTAPAQNAGTVVVRATSVAVPELFDEAVVTVRDPNAIQELRAAAVSVSRGPTHGTAMLSNSVSVRHGFEDGTAAATATPLAVQYGHASGVNTVRSGETSVQYGFSNQAPARTQAPVSVSYGSPDGQFTASASVSATTGPHIISVSPAQVARGTSVTLTISGANLSGVGAVRFLNNSGAVDSALTVTNISVSADGSTLTATLSVGGSAALGTRVVVLCTPASCSLADNVGPNVIAVVAP